MEYYHTRRLDKIGARGFVKFIRWLFRRLVQKDFGTGEEGIGINFMKKFGGPKDKRINRKEKMSRRQLKIMGTALPIYW